MSKTEKSKETKFIPREVEVLFLPARLALMETRLDDASQFYRQALSSMETTYGVEHPYAVACVLNLCYVCYTQQDLKNASLLFERLLRLAKSKLGLKHPDLQAFVTLMAKKYKKTGMSAESEFFSTQTNLLNEPAGKNALFWWDDLLVQRALALDDPLSRQDVTQELKAEEVFKQFPAIPPPPGGVAMPRALEPLPEVAVPAPPQEVAQTQPGLAQRLKQQIGVHTPAQGAAQTQLPPAKPQQEVAIPTQSQPGTAQTELAQAEPLQQEVGIPVQPSPGTHQTQFAQAEPLQQEVGIPAQPLPDTPQTQLAPTEPPQQEVGIPTPPQMHNPLARLRSAQKSQQEAAMPPSAPGPAPKPVQEDAAPTVDAPENPLEREPTQKLAAQPHAQPQPQPVERFSEPATKPVAKSPEKLEPRTERAKLRPARGPGVSLSARGTLVTVVNAIILLVAVVLIGSQILRLFAGSSVSPYKGKAFKTSDDRGSFNFLDDAHAQVVSDGKRIAVAYACCNWQDTPRLLLDSLTKKPIWLHETPQGLRAEDGVLFYSSDAQENVIIGKMRQLSAFAQKYYKQQHTYPRDSRCLDGHPDLRYTNPFTNKQDEPAFWSYAAINNKGWKLRDRDQIVYFADYARDGLTWLAEPPVMHPGSIESCGLFTQETLPDGGPRVTEFFIHGCDRYGDLLSGSQPGTSYCIWLKNGRNFTNEGSLPALTDVKDAEVLIAKDIGAAQFVFRYGVWLSVLGISLLILAFWVRKMFAG